MFQIYCIFFPCLWTRFLQLKSHNSLSHHPAAPRGKGAHGKVSWPSYLSDKRCDIFALVSPIWTLTDFWISGAFSIMQQGAGSTRLPQIRSSINVSHDERPASRRLPLPSPEALPGCQVNLFSSESSETGSIEWLLLQSQIRRFKEKESLSCWKTERWTANWFWRFRLGMLSRWLRTKHEKEERWEIKSIWL